MGEGVYFICGEPDCTKRACTTSNCPKAADHLASGRANQVGCLTENVMRELERRKQNAGKRTLRIMLFVLLTAGCTLIFMAIYYSIKS